MFAGNCAQRRRRNDVSEAAYYTTYILRLKPAQAAGPGLIDLCSVLCSPPRADRRSAAHLAALAMPSAGTVRLRLQRWGEKHNPVYRIVAAHVRAARDKKFLEILGTYNPHPDRYGSKHVTLNVERIKYWVARGAQPSEPVARLLGRASVIPMFPRRGQPRSAVLDAVLDPDDSAIRCVRGEDEPRPRPHPHHDRNPSPHPQPRPNPNPTRFIREEEDSVSGVEGAGQMEAAERESGH